MNTLTYRAMRGLGIFVTGALAGALAGLLLAPRTGKKTRDMIRKEMDHTMKDLEKTMNKTGKNLREEYTKQVDHLTKQGKAWVDEAKEAIKLN